MGMGAGGWLGSQTHAHQCVIARIKVQFASKSHGCNEFWRSNKCMGCRIGIIAANKVTVVWGDDSILLSFLHVLTVPLANAGATGIGQHSPTKLTQSLGL